MTQQQQQQGGHSFQPSQPGFYIPTIPAGQRAFLTQPVNQMTRPRWQSSQVRQMGSSGYQQIGQIRGGRPRVANAMARREAPYRPGMTGVRHMQSQVMRPVVPASQPQRAAYKLTSNTRNQYPAMAQQQQQQQHQHQPEQAAVVMQVNLLYLYIGVVISSYLKLIDCGIVCEMNVIK